MTDEIKQEEWPAYVRQQLGTLGVVLGLALKHIARLKPDGGAELEAQLQRMRDAMRNHGGRDAMDNVMEGFGAAQK